jgi:AcrR family transcriptional regulator
MARPARADHSTLLIDEVAKQLLAGDEVHIANACKAIGIAPSLANHYFHDKSDLVRSAWLKIVLAFIAEDYEQLDQFGQNADWDGVAQLITKVFSPERTGVRQAHIRGLAAGSQDPVLGKAIATAQRETTENWLGLLENYAKAGVLEPKVDLRTIAIMFTALPIGVTAVQGELSEPARKAMAETWVTMLRAVL